MLSEVWSEAHAPSVFLHLEDSFSVRHVRSKVQVHSAWFQYLFHRPRRSVFVVRTLPSPDDSGVRCDRLGRAHLLARHLALTYAHTGEIATRGMSARRPNHALQRTRPSSTLRSAATEDGRHGCNRGVPWAGSLSLGR